MKSTLHNFIGCSKNSNIDMSRYFEYTKNGVFIPQVNSKVQFPCNLTKQYTKNITSVFLLLLLFNCLPVYKVCTKHEVTNPQTGTSPDLGSTAYCYVVILYDPPRLIFLMPDDSMRGQTNTACTIMPYPSSKYVPAQDHPYTQSVL